MMKSFLWGYTVCYGLLLVLSLFEFRRGLYAQDLHDPAKLGLIFALFLGFAGFPVIGSFYLKHRTRTRRVLLPTTPIESQRGEQSLEIALPSLRDAFAGEFSKIRLLAGLLPIIFATIILWPFLRAISAKTIEPSSRLEILFIAIVGACFAMSGIVAYIETTNLRRALKNTEGKSLKLRLDAEALRVPIFLLTNPAFWRTGDAGLDHLKVAWNDIAAWSVEQGSGNARPQHVLTVQGEAARFGVGVLGTGPELGAPTIGIHRDPIKTHETEILEWAAKFLRCPININDDLPSKLADPNSRS